MDSPRVTDERGVSWTVGVEDGAGATDDARPSGVYFRSTLDETKYLPLADLYLPTSRELGELTERELRLMLSRANDVSGTAREK